MQERACFAGSAVSCRAAIDVRLASGKDTQGIAELAHRGCQLEAGSACVIAGDLSSEGRAAAIDRELAIKAYAHACTLEGGPGCVGLDALCKQGVLDACERKAGVAKPMVVRSGPAASALDKAESLRRSGKDADAARLLEETLREHKTARIQAELGLAYQGSGSFVGAERLLTEAMAAQEDPWVANHRSGLEEVLRHSKSHLGRVVLECSSEGQEGHVVGSKLACDRAFRIEIGAHTVELRAPGRRSLQLLIKVLAGERTVVKAELEPYTCQEPGMLHMAGDNGGCCYPGQSWAGDVCTGDAEGSVAMVTHTAIENSKPSHGLASMHLRLLGGVTSFIGASLFRSGVSDSSKSTVFGPRGELRLGFHLGSFITMDAVLGSSRQGFSYWGDCEGGTGDCVSSFPFTDTSDFGVIWQAHTNPDRSGGSLDLHLGAGVRPWSRIVLEDQSGGTAKLTSTVLPGELGASLFLGESVSLDVLGQGEVWLPWKYCDVECVGPEGVQTAFAWSAMAGLSLHLD